MFYPSVAVFSAALIMGTIYALPKSIFVRGINYFFPRIITSFKSNVSIALTIDDVPYGSEKEIIELCDLYNIKVTLFIIANRDAKEKEDFFINAVKNGHQLANHGITNSAHYLKSQDDLREEIEECWKFIADIYRKADVPPPKKLYRPGCGLFSKEMLQLTEELGFRIVLGSLYPHDPHVPFSMVNYCNLIKRVEGGDIIIVHDRSWTVGMLEKFFENCPYKFEVLDEIE